MFQKTGAERICSAIEVFTKTEKELELGISELDQEAVIQTGIIAEAKMEIEVIEKNKIQAERILTKLKEILS